MFSQMFENATKHTIKKEGISNCKNCTGLLCFKVNGKQQQGTAFLISADMAITSVHNLVSRQKSTIAKHTDIRFYAGANGYLEVPNPVIAIKYDPQAIGRMVNHKQGVHGNVALIKVSRKVARQKYYQLAVNFNRKDSRISVIGYPESHCQKQSNYCESKQHTIDAYKFSQQQTIGFEQAIFNQRYEGAAMTINPGQNVMAFGFIMTKSQKARGRLFTWQDISMLMDWERQLMETAFVIRNASEGNNRIVTSKEIKQKIINKELQNQLSKMKIESLQFDWEMSSPYSHHFLNEGSKITRKKKDGEWYQLHSQKPLPQNCEISFKIHHYGGKFIILLGIITEDQLGQQFTGHEDQPECLAFWSKPKFRKGAICLDGVKTHDYESKLFVEEGQVLTMQLKASETRVEWMIGPNFVGQSKLSPHYKSKRVFCFASMYEKGDCIQLV